MQVIVEGKTGSERVEHYEYARRHLQVLLRQGKDRIPYGPEQQVQCLLLVLIHDRGQIMGQCKNKMEVRDARDHFRLAKATHLFSLRYPQLGQFRFPQAQARILIFPQVPHRTRV